MRKRVVLVIASVIVLIFAAAELLLPRERSLREVREQILRQDLTMMRQVLGQYPVDLHRRPRSLDDLVLAGYLRQIPTDPMTGRRDTWVGEMSTDPKLPGLVDVHSGSHSVSNKGNAYSKW